MKRLALTFLLILGLAMGSSFAFSPAHATGQGGSYDQTQILVKFIPGTPPEEETETHHRHGGQAKDMVAPLGVQVVAVSSGSAPEKVKAYREEAWVEFAELDHIFWADFTPNDPQMAKEWGLEKIQAPAAWDITQGSRGVRVAILDTGIDRDHEDLKGKLVAERNFTNSPTVDDMLGHGTHVAGIAAAITNNGKGVAGTGFNTRLINAKVLADDGGGNASWIANGIIWATDNGARVINLSLGSAASSQTIEAAMDYAWGKGVVLVAAAGNESTDAPSFPAFHENAIAVAATDKNDARASFSNFGEWVDIAAPGVGIFSTLPNHANRFGPRNYGTLSGTSMATPFVTGVAALVSAAHPDLTNAQIRAIILATADPTAGFSSPTGRVNALRAVQQASK